MASISSSYTSAPTHYLYDVFLSFRREDSRYTFIDHLYLALSLAGITTFRDDNEFQISQELKPEIERSITQSRAFIIVFSNNYANSSWCLDELCLILEQERKGNYLVLPLYYGVDPSDVWNHMGNFRIEACKEGSYWTTDNANRWKAALTEVANSMVSAVSGYRSESSLIPDIVKTIYSQLEINLTNTPLDFNHLIEHDMGGTFLKNLFVSNKEIAKGSNGTIVFEGIYDGRKVAVKRLVKAHYDAVSREIHNLIAADLHPNIVRWYDTASDRDFFYLSLERCDCTLYDLIQNNMYSDSFQLMKPNGYPSSILLVLMRDISAGLVHLQDLGIIHRDLKPHNVLIVRRERLCVKLAYTGISKPLDGDVSSLGPHATGN